MSLTTTLEIRVYYEDTDFSGLVYHANYLKYFERGRTEGLRHCGFTNSALIAREEPLVFAVRKMDLDYHLAARMDDLLTITTTVTEVKGARMIFDQKAERDGVLIASAQVIVACLTPEGRPRRIPQDVISVFND
ncbi:tol-pal system-associated acyl-CoA thioesterase [Parvularcula marina]|uniref:tol-pal system-associated acyl-CoA thioesterase n=1 Tax=Parvularcula marina TaxID=2292771 RepID=UPI003517EA52